MELSRGEGGTAGSLLNILISRLSFTNLLTERGVRVGIRKNFLNSACFNNARQRGGGVFKSADGTAQLKCPLNSKRFALASLS